MKIIEGFKLRNVAGEMVVSGESVNQINFNKLIALNSTAALIWQKVEGKEFTTQTMADILLSEFEITPEQALADSNALAQSWIECGVIEQ